VPSRRGSASACRRVGVSAFEKCHQLHRNLMMAVSTGSPTSNMPTRRYADAPIRFPTGERTENGIF
jgi:hypothetical protein